MWGTKSNCRTPRKNTGRKWGKERREEEEWHQADGKSVIEEKQRSRKKVLLEMSNPHRVIRCRGKERQERGDIQKTATPVIWEKRRCRSYKRKWVFRGKMAGEGGRKDISKRAVKKKRWRGAKSATLLERRIRR